MLCNIYEGFLNNGLIVSLLKCQLVSISCSINRIASNFFFGSYDARGSLQKPSYLYFVLLLIASFCIFFWKCSLIWVTFCTKLRLGGSRRAISSIFYVFIVNLLWCTSLILLSGDIKTNPGPISISGQCFSICHWNSQHCSS